MSKDPKKPDEATKSETDEATEAESQGELDDLELKQVTGGAASAERAYFNERVYFNER